MFDTFSTQQWKLFFALENVFYSSFLKAGFFECIEISATVDLHNLTDLYVFDHFDLVTSFYALMIRLKFANRNSIFYIKQTSQVSFQFQLSNNKYEILKAASAIFKEAYFQNSVSRFFNAAKWCLMEKP